MSSDTVASKAFAVRRRRVSPTASGRWPPSFFFFFAVCGALAIQETAETGMLPSAMMREREAAVTRETSTIGRSFLLAVSPA